MQGEEPTDLSLFREEVRTWLNENDPGEPPPLDTQRCASGARRGSASSTTAGGPGSTGQSSTGVGGSASSSRSSGSRSTCRPACPSGTAVSSSRLPHAGPTLIARGSDEQKSQYLPPILRGETPWCQGFSEPESGSDLASLKTRAEIDGDTLVVNGQKVWTSYAHLADFQELLVRTDPTAPKHKGITWVICDMRTPGIEVRPIRTIDGGAHFSEIFYEDVRIPIANVVDEINEGWSVAMSTLAIERGPAALDYQLGTLRDIDELIKLAKDRQLLKNEELR